MPRVEVTSTILLVMDTAVVNRSPRVAQRTMEISSKMSVVPVFTQSTCCPVIERAWL
jgi:hypothetical protein